MTGEAALLSPTTPERRLDGDLGASESLLARQTVLHFGDDGCTCAECARSIVAGIRNAHVRAIIARHLRVTS